MQGENAYFTVEAALVFPMALGTMLFVVYMLLYQYDRCLLEQDLAAMALWGGCAQLSPTEELEERTRDRLEELYQDKYVAWEMLALEASVERNRFTVRGGGQVLFPFWGWNFWSQERAWDAEAEYGCDRLSPVTFIRRCRTAADLLHEEEAER